MEEESKSSDLLGRLRLGLAEQEEVAAGMGSARDCRLVSGAGEDRGVASRLEGRLLSHSLIDSSSNSSSGSNPGAADSIELVVEARGGADIALRLSLRSEGVDREPVLPAGR